MNTYGEYVDIPSIPSDIVLNSEEILALPEIEYSINLQQEWRAAYKSKRYLKKVNPQLKDWLKEHFQFDMFAYYCIYPLLMGPHVDIRPIAYNYYIDTGGEVDTVFYNKAPNAPHIKVDEKEPLKRIARIRFDPNRWVKLQTNIPHGTEGKVRRPRIFISVTETDSAIIKDEMVTNW